MSLVYNESHIGYHATDVIDSHLPVSLRHTPEYVCVCVCVCVLSSEQAYTCVTWYDNTAIASPSRHHHHHVVRSARDSVDGPSTSRDLPQSRVDGSTAEVALPRSTTATMQRWTSMQPGWSDNVSAIVNLMADSRQRTTDMRTWYDGMVYSRQSHRYQRIERRRVTTVNTRLTSRQRCAMHNAPPRRC